MPTAAKLYIAGVIATGGLILGSSLPHGLSAKPAHYLIFLILAVLASLLKVRLPGMTGTYSLNFLFILIGIAHFTLAETLVAGCAAALAQSYLNAQKRPTPVQVIFNVGNLALSVGICFLAAYGPLSSLLQANRPATLALVACLYFVANTFLVSGVLSLLQGKPLGEVCREWYVWSFPYYLVGAVLVGLFPTVGAAPDPEAWLLLVPPLYLVHFFYGLGRGSLGDRADLASQDSGLDLPFRAKLYIEAVIGFGAVLLVVSLLRADIQDVPRFVSYVAIAAVASACKVRVPRVTSTISLGFVIQLAAIAELGLAEALVIGATGAAVQSLWKPKVRPRRIQVAFSMAALVLSVAAAHTVCNEVLPAALGDSLISLLAVATGLFYAANTLLVAAALCLVEQRPLRRIWQHCCFWSFSYYMVGAACAGLMVVTSRSSGWEPALLVLPVMVLVYISYRLHLGRVAEA